MKKYTIKIVTDLDKLTERVDEITATTDIDTVRHVVNEIKDTLSDYPNTVALCAPQVGQQLRLFCVKTANDQVKVFLNPIIVQSEGLHLSREINPSLPNKQYIIPRKDKIHVAYQDIDGRPNSDTYLGVYAEVIQQMIEMLDGILLCDYGLDLDDVGGPDKFDKASKKDKETLLQMYLDHLRENSKDLHIEIENTPELKAVNDEIDFIAGMLTGEIKPVDAEGNIVENKA